MTTHLTVVRFVDDNVVAYCPEHQAVDQSHPDTRIGRNAAILAARQHDDVHHGIYRADAEYRRIANLD